MNTPVKNTYIGYKNVYKSWQKTSILNEKQVNAALSKSIQFQQANNKKGNSFITSNINTANITQSQRIRNSQSTIQPA